MSGRSGKFRFLVASSALTMASLGRHWPRAAWLRRLDAGSWPWTSKIVCLCALLFGLCESRVAWAQPFGGTPWSIPGQVEAEDYDLGGSGVGYFDANAGNLGGQYRADDVDIWFDSGGIGYYVGAMNSGEWLAYTVDVAASGPYVLELEVTNPFNGRALHVELGGLDVTGPVGLPNTGAWGIWQTVSVPVTLAAGQQVMRVVVDTGWFNLNRVVFSAAGTLPTVATPAIAPNGGTFEGSVDVTLATATSGALIYYTTDGSVPSAASTLYAGPFTLTADATVQAIGVAGGFNDSSIASATFSITSSTAVEVPAITPNGGTYAGSVEVTLSTATLGASIYYTIDGSVPSASSTLYAGPFTLTADATVRAIGVAAGLDDSGVATAAFTITALGGDGQLAYGGVPWSIPGLVEAEDYDLGGSSVAYSDANAGNLGGQYRADDVDIWFDSGGIGYYVGAMNSGEWLEYTVNVAASGSYVLELEVTNPFNGRALHVELGGLDVTGPVSLPNTGAWGIWQTVGVPVNLAAGQQVMRVFVDTGWFNLNRVVFSAAGTLSMVATPTIAPNGGAFDGSVDVSLATATPGASIYYTIDGGAPSASSTLYTGPFTLTSDATVQAIGVLAGADDSGVASAGFTVTPLPIVATPVIAPNGGVFDGSVDVTLSTTTPGAAIHYTTDGSPPGTASTLYAGPFTLTANATVQAIGVASGFNDSGIASATFSVTPPPMVATPAITPNGGSYLGSVQVTLATTTPGASIYYTTDGSAPGPSSTLYTGPFLLTSSATVQAVGVLTGLGDSLVAGAAFTVTASGGAQQPYQGTPWQLPGQVEAEDYDLGGGNIAYFDTGGGNLGGQYRSDDVDIWLGAGGYYVGAMNTGEWLEYTVNVPASGNYVLDFRVSNPFNGRALHAEFGGLNVTGPVSLPNTGSWGVWEIVSVPVTLAAGHQVMRVSVNTGWFNLDWVAVRPSEGPTITPAGGTFTNSVEVTIETDQGSAIRYTTDGTLPDSTSPLYQGAISVSSTSTLSALAFDQGQPVGAVSTANFGIVKPTSIAAWNRWEQTLVSTNNYANPYADLTLSATFVGPGGQVFESFGFWDGDNIFKIRFMFPEPGTWAWSATTSDPTNADLVQQGTVTVSPYAGGNHLYQRGYLKVSGNRKYLTYADGTPFFWLAGTTWGGPTNATQTEWESYVDNRSAKGFNALLISIANDFTNDSDGNSGGGGAGAADVNGNRPFFGESVNNLERWNPAFWQYYEDKVAYANQQGLIVLIDGVAQPRRIDPLDSESAALQLFARNLAARFMGDFVVFAQQYDRPYSQVGNDVGFALREATSIHLITNHPPGVEDRNGDGINDSLDTAEDFFDQPYLDFSGNQPGGGWVAIPIFSEQFDNELAAQRAIEWSLQLYNHQPPKPLIVSESAYDASLRHDPDDPYHTSVRDAYLPRMARSAAYWNVLSGSAGYSYGVGQTYYWGPRNVDAQAGQWSTQDALDVPSAFEMTLMKEFFSSLEWWRLAPDHDLILNQPVPWIERMVLAKSSNGDLAVAYLPDNSEILVDMSAFPTDMSITWFNPVTGTYQPTSETVSNGGPATVARPAQWEDAVLLLAPSVSTPTIAPNGGVFDGSVDVALSTTTPGASIYYTTDGSPPDTSSTLYAGPFTLTADATVQAIGVAGGLDDSGIASAEFTVVQTVAAPTIAPNGGAFDDSVDVTLSTATPGASIYYTIDGSPPDAASTPYSGPFTLTSDATVQAIALLAGANDSAIVSAVFTVTSLPTVATPSITPNGGSFDDSVDVTLATATPGASVYYTTDGSIPSAASALYSGPFTLTSDATVQAIGVLAGANDSSVASAGFTVTPATIPGLDSRPSNLTCVAPDLNPLAGPVITLTQVFASLGPLSQPVGMLQAPGDPDRWFVPEKGGRIRVIVTNPLAFDNDFIDLAQSFAVNATEEGGLLGMAFHPDFAANGEVFLSWTEGTPMVSVVSRFTSADGGATLDPASREDVITVNQDTGTHNGGHIAFGPDGNLYVGFGDGGGAGDPNGRGQDATNMLGSVLRLDVDGGSPYAIPGANPFAGNPVCRADHANVLECPEIFAWGFRNPWRWSFDSATGDLWLGDVGQDALEEIDIVGANGNYGWDCREGSSDFTGPPDAPSGVCTTISGLQDPVHEYPHSDGFSVTGGYVYRGAALTTLVGDYVFGDFGTGRIWRLTGDGGGGWTEEELLDTSLSIVAFGQGNDGELYVVDYVGGGLYQIVDGSGQAQPPIGGALSESGCVDPLNPSQPASGLIPYDVAAPFWSDGADKQRWLAIPDGTTVGRDADGDFILPSGTVLMKHFRVAGQLVETRLFMRHLSGEWAGYSYEWDENETDALLVEGGKVGSAGAPDWIFPSGNDCMACHTASAGFSLGLEDGQLNHDFDYPSTGRTANQLSTFDHIGLFTTPLPDPEVLDALADPEDSNLNLEDRARAYLHTNCAQCHRPNGPTPSSMDLRFDTPLELTAACEAPPQSGDLGLGPAARIIAVGDPDNSVLLERMSRRDVYAMPPLASSIPDAAGATLVRDWIASLTTCP